MEVFYAKPEVDKVKRWTRISSGSRYFESETYYERVMVFYDDKNKKYKYKFDFTYENMLPQKLIDDIYLHKKKRETWLLSFEHDLPDFILNELKKWIQERLPTELKVKKYWYWIRIDDPLEKYYNEQNNDVVWQNDRVNGAKLLFFIILWIIILIIYRFTE
jgi:hypothetical protein